MREREIFTAESWIESIGRALGCDSHHIRVPEKVLESAGLNPSFLIGGVVENLRNIALSTTVTLLVLIQGCVRTGRASVSLLDTVMVDYYGTMTPLNQMASVHSPEAQLLTVQPWDQTQLRRAAPVAG